MKVSRTFLKLARKALAESIDFRSMIHLARELIPNYDINKQRGVSENISITRIEAAEQIINDMYERNIFMQFLNIILSIQYNGYMGRKYKISGYKEIINEIYKLGFIYDRETEMLMEHPQYRISRNWGALMEGEDYYFSFIWIDIMGYSRIVKKYPAEIVEAVYRDFIDIVREKIEKRNGRIWIVDGDGVLGAFHFSNKSQMSVLSAMEILHEFDTYNLLNNRMGSPLNLRMSVNIGKCEYSEDNVKAKQNEIISETIELVNKSSEPNQLVISTNIESMLDTIFTDLFFPHPVSGIPEYYTYSIKWN